MILTLLSFWQQPITFSRDPTSDLPDLFLQPAHQNLIDCSIDLEGTLYALKLSEKISFANCVIHRLRVLFFFAKDRGSDFPGCYQGQQQVEVAQD